MNRRIKQFLLGIFSRLNSEDLDYINGKLDNDIRGIFADLSGYEKKHSVLTAKAIEKYLEDNNKVDPDLVKAALLHDIGKTRYHLNIIQKSVLVIFDYITGEKIKKYSGNKSIHIFYNHGEIGYDILKSMGYNDRILSIVRNHHNKSKNSDDLEILRKFDDMY